MERQVLVIGTGGTIASEPTGNGYAPLRTSSFFRRIRHHPQLSDLTYSQTPIQTSDQSSDPLTPITSGPETTHFPVEQLANAARRSLSSPGSRAGSRAQSQERPQTPRYLLAEDEEVVTVQKGRNTLYPALRTPELDDDGRRVVYEILDLDRHMDSSEMTPSEWNIIASLIEENWDKYEGFVILSGTDTLAYTASILSFLFTHTGKPIIVTGAQIPLSQPRSDGWTNLLESLFVAGVMNFAGVGIVFHHQVLKGCRATKTSPNLFAAFSTPCVPPLINLNVKITFDPSLSPRSPSLPPRLISLVTSPTVLSCSIHPGVTGHLLSAQTEAVPSCRAVILSAYGSGNMPVVSANGVLDALERMVKREILVVVISQCALPAVYPLYTQGRMLLDIGVLPGYDLTHEAAFAKLLWLVSRKDLTFKQRQEVFQQPVAGEMSVGPSGS